MTKKSVRLYLVMFIVIALASARSQSEALQASEVAESSNYAHCRFGVTAHQDIAAFDVAPLNLGWYVDWGMNVMPATPGGMEYMQMVRLQQEVGGGWGFRSGQSWTTLAGAIGANPGATWLVGNEPDSPFQDDMLPQSYAHAYHDVYSFIKGQDPTARVGIGGIVQPTPLRFAYLDAVWDAYHQTYGEKMPVEVWNIHSFILREVASGVVPDPEPCGASTIPEWGANIPPGQTALTGELYCIRDQDRLDIFWGRIRDFRQWMVNNGERDKPLIISEYGVLFPEDYRDEDGNLFDQQRVGQYMIGTFERMRNETDPMIGYPHDGNRLVQRWAWFSLSESPNDWGGTLFDANTHSLRPLGQTFRDYTSVIAPSVDLLAARASSEPAVFWYEGQPVTATLKAVVSNVGNSATAQPVTVEFFDGQPGDAGSVPIGSAQTISGGLGGCADYAVVSIDWSGLGAGGHPFYIQVDRDNTIAEADETNNIVSGTVLVATRRAYLPLAVKNGN
jgi:hypothetical protein